MDQKLTEFIGLTGSDPGLARDLLGATDWDVQSALRRYESIKGGIGPHKGQPVADSPDGGPLSPLRPRLQKGQAVDDYKEKRLKRGISKATDNCLIVTQARNLVINELAESEELSHNCLMETPEYTFVLPDLTTHPTDFRAFLEKDLIETSTLVSLEQAGCLNWWAEIGACQRLWPLATSGDGNCLLHAASLGMWGFHDRLLTLRKALHNTLTSGSLKMALYRRWRWQQMMNNKEVGFEFSDQDWETEWCNLLKLASAEPRSQSGRPSSCCDSPATKGSLPKADTQSEVYYESLEEFHVFVLAHVLKRPIVVIADKFLKNFEGEAIAPIPFGGVYLPYECQPTECHKSPLVLTYDAAHFSALVAMETDKSTSLPVMIPVVGPDFNLLPLHFSVDPGSHFVWNRDEKDHKKLSNLMMTPDKKLQLMEKYLVVECASIPTTATSEDDDETKSNSGSVDSSENSGGTKLVTTQLSDGGKTEKERSKMAKQMQSVAKQFGSIGKSMGKKLMSMGKVGKKDSDKDGNGKDGGEGKKRPRKLSVGAVTQSTRVNLVNVLNERDRVLCAKMTSKRTGYQQDMLKNYMASARLRFEQDREMKQLRAEEMKQRASRQSALVAGLRCANSFCNRESAENLNYLCQQCFDQQKQQVVEIQRSPNLKRLSNYDNVPDVGGNNVSYPPITRTDTLVAPGKSKFYTPSETNLSYYSDRTAGTIPLQRGGVQDQHHPVPLGLSNSTFYQQCANTGNNVRLPSISPYGCGPSPGSPVSPLHSPNMALRQPTNSRVIVSNKIPPIVQRDRSPGPVSVGHSGPDEQMRVTRFVSCDRPHEPMRKNNAARPLVVRDGCLRTGYDAFDLQMDRALREQCGGNSNRPITTQEVWSAGDEVRRQCKSANCKFYGSEATDFLCSECFRSKQKTLSYLEVSRMTKM